VWYGQERRQLTLGGHRVEVQKPRARTKVGKEVELAIRTALKGTFGERVLIARCHQHKRKNVLDHLPEEQRTFIGRRLDKAWRQTDP